jgi:hypothetical protein
VLVAGHLVFLNGRPTEVLGTQRTGSFLRTNTTTPATTRTAAEPLSTAAIATYAYDQIDQARAELNAVSK